jgi:hypothetical protein
MEIVMSQKKIVKMTRWICDDDPEELEEDIKEIIKRETWKTKKQFNILWEHIKPSKVDITVIVEPAKPKKKKE